MSEGVSRCEVATRWSEQGSYIGPVQVWRPNIAPPPPVLPSDGPRTLEEMVAAHKARQARMAVAVAREQFRLREIREWNRKAAAEAKRLAEEKEAEAKRLKNARECTASYPSIREIINVVCHEFEVTPIDIISCRRGRGGVFYKTIDIITPRHVAIYLAKVTTTHSFLAIARQFGKRDHSTIHHAVHKIAARMEVDDAFRAKVEELRAILTQRGRGEA